MAKQKTLVVNGLEIKYYEQKSEDFISLTDIAKKYNDRTDQIISNWLRRRITIDFLGTWEGIHNVDFNPLSFEGIRNQAGAATFVLSVSDWVKQTAAIGIRAKAGRYGGTYAHKDIALEFLSFLDPSFKLFVLKEFQRLKIKEAEEEKQALDWTIKRTLSKVNYHIHTDAVKKYLVPPKITNEKSKGLFYANEADVLNVAMFGMTAKEWRIINPELKGNMRDYATSAQLLVLANLENLNAEFIAQGAEQELRLQRLNEIAIHQMQLLGGIPVMKNLEEGE